MCGNKGNVVRNGLEKKRQTPICEHDIMLLFHVVFYNSRFAFTNFLNYITCEKKRNEKEGLILILAILWG